MKKGMALILALVLLMSLLAACDNNDDTNKPCQHD